jgi:predicted nucleic acid-binding protein
MPIVLDASITASWHFPDERNARSDTVLDSLERDSAIVPTHWWFEIRNVLLLGERRQRSKKQDTVDFLGWLIKLPIRNAPLPDGGDVLALARKHQLTFYDAAYLELALREGLGLATLDKQLIAAAYAEGVSLVAAD